MQPTILKTIAVLTLLAAPVITSDVIDTGDDIFAPVAPVTYIARRSPKGGRGGGGGRSSKSSKKSGSAGSNSAAAAPLGFGIKS
ncbi:hypothetical protein P167DRAFT_571369 [Morchella conica CCBAS932]|uniref:Uncharacterized protein n=1 Tax=Morchella conica CCBAS932 TaxID=1392247 RepID=A0A3N4L507_9PEZI|nr:hypothetical protein P167DRAFT_571369 [Morchella conica CCBAS932]